MEKFWRITKRVALGLLIVLILLIGAGFVIIRYYEDDVVGYALTKLNDRLKTKANVGSADLTFWETFPKASIRFTDVYIQETFPEKDTLFFSQKVYLSFDLMDVFSGNYDIKKISAEEAKAYMKVNKKGEDNWHFLKEEESDTSRFKMALENIEVENANIVYEDRSSEFFIDLVTSKSEAGGSFESEQFELELDMEAQVNSLISGSTEYAVNRKVDLETLIDAQTKEGNYSINECKISIDELPFILGGSVSLKEQTYVDIKIEGDNLTLSDVISKLPQENRDQLSVYDADGTVSFDATLKGLAGEGKIPDIKANFSIQEGNLKHNETGVSLSSIVFDGSYIRGAANDQLKLDKFSASLEGGIIEANGTIDHLDNPYTDLHLKLDVGLSELSKFFNWDTLEVCEGRVYAQADFKGPLGAVDMNGKGEITQARLKLKNSNRDFTDLATTVVFSNKDAVVQRLHGKVNGSDFIINGALRNLIPFIAGGSERLNVEATLNSNLIDFTQLVETEESTNTNRDYSFSLPQFIDFSLQTKVKKFVFGKFEATDVTGVARLQNQVFRIDPVSFNTSEGGFLSQIELAQRADNSFGLTCFAKFDQINIQKMFYQFDNFGQTFITDQNLRGKATASIEFKAPVSKELRIQTDNIYSIIDISIANGQLIGLESLQEIAQYLKSNKLIAPFVDEDKFAERMKDIKFSNLENIIEIKDRKINIPLMDIRSSALDISASGTHTFDNVIDYTIGFRLRDILVKKSQDWQEQDDGLGKLLYIYMRGTTEKPEFGIDKEASKEIRKEEIAAEKQNMKALLKQEFGLFKNDNTIGAYQEKPAVQESTTTIQWEESDPAAPVEQEEKPKPKLSQPETPKGQDNSKETAKGKKLPKWLQEKE